MSEPVAVKSRLKKNLLVYSLLHAYRSRRDNRAIAADQDRYERQAREWRMPLGEAEANSVEAVRKRLAHRGLAWPPVLNGRKPHILYLSLPGNWERHNIPPELEKVGDASYFFLEDQGIPWKGQDWPSIRAQVDRQLPEFVVQLHKKKPIDLVLSYLSGSQISPPTIKAIGRMGIAVFSLHMDDRLYFHGYRYGDQWSGPAAVCRAYDLNLTNALESIVKYRVEESNVLFWPPGANPEYFKPLDLPKKYDVTFCGQMYGKRPLLIDYLRRKGIKVDCFGRDWEHGYQTDRGLVDVFNQSRINLGLGYVGWSDFQCVKGRDFEIPSCGSVYLTSHNQNLERLYRIGKEIETYHSFGDCYQKIKQLLAYPERCREMGLAARKAVVNRHTWSGRVQQLLDLTIMEGVNGNH